MIDEQMLRWRQEVNGELDGLRTMERVEASPVFNVAARGGKAGDSTYDTLNKTAINDAITDANTAGGGIVYLDAGDWYVDGTIIPKNHVWLVGRSSYGQADSGEETRLIQTDNTANTIRQVSSNGHTEGMGFKNITIVYQDNTRTAGGGIVLEDDGGGAFIGVHIGNVIVRYHARGVHIENTVMTSVEKCRVLNCGTAYLIDADASGAGITTTAFRDCFAQNCNVRGWDVNGGPLTSVQWVNCAVDACDYGWYFGGVTLRNVGLYDCYVEDRASGPDVVSAVLSSGTWQGFKIVGLTVYNAKGHALDLSGTGSMAIIGGRVQNTAATFYDLNHTGTGYIDLVGDYKTMFSGAGAGRINDSNDAVVYHDYRTLQSQRQDSAGANTVVAAHTQYGIVEVTSDTGASSVTAAVTYPEAYSSVHGALADMQSFGLGGKVVVVNVESVGSSGLTVRVATADGGNFGSEQTRDVFWLAKGIRF